VDQELKAALSEFVGFAQTLRGDEKSEAQTFLDHFFRAKNARISSLTIVFSRCWLDR